MTDFTKENFRAHFACGATRKALLMSGCMIGGFVLGMSAPGMIEAMHSGFSIMATYLPLGDPVQVAAHYFDGTLTWLGSVVIGSAEKVLELGGQIPGEFADSVQQIQSQFVSCTTHMRQMFDQALNRSAEMAALWSTIVRDTVARPALNAASSVLEMIPDNPRDAAAAFGTLMVRGLEAFGVVKGMHEAYKWTIGLFRKELKSDPATVTAAQSSGLSIGTVTNLSINLSLAGTDGSRNALQQLEHILAMGKDSKIEVDESVLRGLLGKGPDHVSGPEDLDDHHTPGDDQDQDGAMEPLDRAQRDPGILTQAAALQVSRKLSSALQGAVSERMNRPDQALGSITIRPLETIDGGIIAAMGRKPGYSGDRARISRYMPDLEMRKSATDNPDRPNGPLM